MKKTILSALAAVSIIGAFAIGLSVGMGMHNYTKVETKYIAEEIPLTEWEIMKLAIIKTESEFNPLAVGKGGDWGIFQITPIYVKEVNRILGEEKYSHEDAFNPQKSMDMFNIMQEKHNPSKNVDKAIVSHNPTATSAYYIRVRKNMDFIRKCEELRTLAR